jgi:hypothetical protein
VAVMTPDRVRPRDGELRMAYVMRAGYDNE